MNFKSNRKNMKKIFAALVACIAASALAAPLKIKMIIGFPAGGPDDRVARMIQTEIQQKYPSTIVVIEPALGAGGLIALNKLVNSEKSDYIEVLFGGSNLVGATYITKTNTTVDLDKDVKIVAPIGYSKMVLLASRQIGATTVADIKRISKVESPRVGTAGSGSLSHLTAEHFFSQMDTTMINVPYKGTSAVYPDLIASRVDYLFDFPMGATPKIESGLVVPIAVTGTTRIKSIPSVPALAELGIKNPPFSPWWAIYANKNISDDDFKLLNSIFTEILMSKDIANQFGDLGAVTWAASDLSNPDRWFTKQKELYKREATRFESIVNVTR